MTEADALLTMGEGEAGLRLHQSVLNGYEALVRQEPGRADFLRDLSVSYNKLGDLMRDLGQGDDAHRFFQKSLDIAEQLVRQEPGRADFQTDLVASLVRLGDQASLTRALDIVRRLESEGRLTARQAGWRQGLEEMLNP